MVRSNAALAQAAFLLAPDQYAIEKYRISKFYILDPLPVAGRKSALCQADEI